MNTPRRLPHPTLCPGRLTCRGLLLLGGLALSSCGSLTDTFKPAPVEERLAAVDASLPPVGAPVGTVATGTVVYVSPNAEELTVIRLVNEVRLKGTLEGEDAVTGTCAASTFKANALSTVSYRGSEAFAARQHARWLGEYGYTGHTQGDAAHPAYYGATFSERMNRSYLDNQKAKFNWGGGENVAAGYDSPAAVMRAWMNSDGHCKNLMSPELQYVGTGYYRNPAITNFSDQPNGVKRYAESWVQVFTYIR